MPPVRAKISHSERPAFGIFSHPRILYLVPQKPSKAVEEYYLSLNFQTTERYILILSPSRNCFLSPRMHSIHRLSWSSSQRTRKNELLGPRVLSIYCKNSIKVAIQIVACPEFASCKSERSKAPILLKIQKDLNPLPLSHNEWLVVMIKWFCIHHHSSLKLPRVRLISWRCIWKFPHIRGGEGKTKQKTEAEADVEIGGGGSFIEHTTIQMRCQSIPEYS